MHNRLSFIAIAMVMAMTTIFSSCSDKDEQDETGYTQQSILVFMPWSDNSLHQSLMANLDSIEAGIKAQKAQDGRAKMIGWIILTWLKPMACSMRKTR